jgi:dolichol-phosphate mannosyltransferase
VQVCVVVPTFNEAASIEQLLSGVFDSLPYASVIVVDDASPDGTADLVDRVGPAYGDVSVLRRSAKTGLGDAYRAGLAAAIERGADICVQMDADLSHDPVVLPALVAIVEHGADLAIGSRYVPGGLTENWPRRRRWLSRWGNRYAAGVLGLAVNDATAGYRAYSAAALRRSDFQRGTAQGFGFQVEMTHRLVRSGGKVVEFPITFREREQGDSKMSGGIVREALVLVIKMWLADFGGRRRRRAIGA